MTYSQKYAIVQFFEPVKEGYEFSMNEWPLHTTLADVFAVNLNQYLIDQLSSLLSTTETFEVVTQNDTILGTAENPVHVTLIEKTPKLQSLHDSLVNLLEKNGAVFNSPQYNHDGYLPHVTIQNQARINNSDVLKISKLSVIDLYVDGDWQQREVVSSMKLLAK